MNKIYCYFDEKPNEYYASLPGGKSEPHFTATGMVTMNQRTLAQDIGKHKFLRRLFKYARDGVRLSISIER